ncbi:DNRLRE domain-containing protein [Rossellomorea aquimaris]|uniref:DNRLRE domain-containing protein n=1 Tax=Rossellomorea aquimaris TaxID=189382 RepID=UPI001CD4CA2E|nr:DNRLRE domain-containing protein [Rossellomorea aquimaris]MCA1057597.1 DNRLRE domain-containing protein [Rossellomorea aquimaris]
MRKKMKAFLTIQMIAVMILASLPMSVFAEEFKRSSQEQKEPKIEPLSEGKEYSKTEVVNETEYKDLKPGDEIVEERTENSKVFYSGDNKITKNIYFEPIHKKNEKNGELEEISTHLVEDASDKNEVETENANLLSSFQKKMKNGQYATFEVDGHTITYSILGASQQGESSITPQDVNASYEENRILHKSIFPDIDLRNIAFGDETKEDIILHSYKGFNTFTFQLDTDLKGELTSNGDIEFSDQNEKSIFTIPKPYMEDSNYDDHKGENARSENVKLRLTPNEEGYVLTIEADDEWLSDPDRVYPVYIDPSTSLGTTMDTFVMSKYPTTNYNSGKWDSSQGQYVLKIGEYDSTTGMCYAFLKPQTDGLTPQKGYMVDKATLNLYVTHAYYANSPNGLWIDRVNGNWSSSSLNWNNKPSSTNLTSVNVGRDQWAKADVTQVVKEWNKGTRTNYGFKLHTNGNKMTHWKKVVSASNSSNKPYVSVTYTTLGAAQQPTVKAYSSGKNTGTGYFDLSWSKVTGATGYKVAIFNGKEYQHFDVKNTTSWSTKGKKIWPTPAEIERGTYGLHRDGKGTEFPNDPKSTYVASGGKYTNSHNYWFRVIAYNSEFNVETDISSPAMPTLPDSTRPNVPRTPTVTIQDGPVNSGDSASAILSWKEVTDLPSGIDSGISYYEVQKSINGSWSSAGSVKHTGSNTYKLTVDDLPDDATVAFRVRAFDAKGNDSGYATSSDYKTKDRTSPSTPVSLNVSPSVWSTAKTHTLSWTGITDNQILEAIEYKVDDQPWDSLGVNSESGSAKIPGELKDGIHTVQVRGKDREGNTGQPKSVKIYKDTTAPSISFVSPAENDTIKGIEDIHVRVVNPSPQTTFTNLIHNGDFAQGMEGWTERRSYDSGTTSVEDASGASKDVMVLKLSPVSSSPGTDFGLLATTYDVNLKANTTYTLKGKIRTNLKEANAFFNVESLSKDGKHLQWNDSRTTQLTGVQDWTNHELTFTTPASTEKGRIYLEVDHHSDRGQGLAWFDGISLTEKGKAVNLIQNGDFSSGLEGWTETKANNIGEAQVVEDPTVLSQGDGEKETISIKIKSDSTSPGSELGYLATTYDVTVKPNTTYKITGMIKTNLANANAFFNVNSLKNDGASLSWDDNRDHQLTGVNGWTEQELVFTTPKDTTRARLYLEVDHWNKEASGTAWFDSIRFEEVDQSSSASPYSWTLSYGEGKTPTKYTTLKTGTTSLHDLTYAWNTSDLKEETEYTLRLTAKDEAGNTGEKTTHVMKAKDTTSIAPAIQVTNPIHEGIVTDALQKVEYQIKNLSLNTLSQALEGFEQVDVFINSTLVKHMGPSEKTTTFDATAYHEGSKNQLYLRGKDAEGAYHYSTFAYRTQGIVDGFEGEEFIGSLSNVVRNGQKVMISGSARSGSIESVTKSVSGNISTVHLSTVEETPSGTSITYEASADGGHTWEEVHPNQTHALSHTGSTLTLRATLNASSTGVSPVLDSWDSEVVYVNKQGNAFNVQLIDVPTNLTATPNVNYMTYLRWNASSTEGVTYSIYRSSTPGFTPSKDTLVAEGVKDSYWNDFQLHYGQTFYYQVVAVKEMKGKERQSLPSNEAWAKSVDQDEVQKQLGLQDFWGYSSFPTATGNGYVNISSGNLVYQSSDFVSVSPQLAMVMRRSFNSQSTTKTPLGYGWDFSFNTALMKEYDDQEQEVGLILKDGDGSLHRFTKKADGGYETPQGIHMTLTKHTDGSYEILRKDQIKYLFDPQMKLIKLTEPNGNALTFVYDSIRGNLKIVINNIGDKTYLFYDHKDRLEKVVDPAQREYHFDYKDSSDRLAKVYQQIGNVTYAEEYKYDDNNQELRGIVDPEKYETKIQYKNGKVLKVTDPISDYSTFAYTEGSTTITSDKGKTVSFTHNPNGTITSKTYEDQHKVNYEYNDDLLVEHMYTDNTIEGVKKTLHHRYTYDDRGNLLTSKDPLGHVTEYKGYNKMNLVKEIIEPVRDGVTAKTTFEYDDKGNLKETTDPEGRTISYTYDDVGNQVTMTNEFKQTTSYDYDAKGRIKKIKEPLGKVTEILEYDSQGNPVKIKDPKGLITTSEYDVLDRLVKTVDPKGYTVKRTYDWNHNLKDISDQKGNLTQFKYDKVGRLTKTIYANGDTEEIEYLVDAKQNEKIVYTDGEGRTSTEYYNEVGQLVQTEAQNTTTQFDYDDVGNMTKVTDGEGRVVESIYDELNRQTKVIVDPTGKKVVTQSQYDDQGNVVKGIDGEGYSTSYQYDKINRLKNVTKQVDGKQLVTSYEYDLLDNTWVKNKVTDALGRQKTTYLDALGRVRKEVNEGTTSDSSKMEQSFEYDLNGNLTKTIHNDGSTVQQEYDERNLMKKVTYGPKHWTRFEYDENGNRELMVDSKDGTTTTSSYAYDPKDRLKEEVQNGLKIAYQYDHSDNVTRVSYPTEEGDQQKDIDYQYDEYDRLESILVEGKKAQDFSYNQAGQVDHTNNYLAFDTGGSSFVKVDYDYNTLGKTETIRYTKDGQAKMEEYQMDYDQRGYMKTETTYTHFDDQEKTIEKAYQYNEAGQLTESKQGDNITTYAYDEVGNRKAMTEGKDSFVYSYNQFNQLEKTTKNGSLHATYVYDKRGNQQKEIVKKQIDGVLNDVTTNYTYDDANQLAQVETLTPGKDTSKVKNWYNGDGQRTRRDADGTITNYVYNENAVLYTADENNRKITENVLNPDGDIVASKRFDGNYKNQYFFYHYDLRGSVTNVVDSDAKRVKGYDYDDFGNIKEVGDKTFQNDVKFTGAVQDTSTGLHYMNSRYYSSDTGRFISQDTYSGNVFDPWTQHLYTYTSNNPINFVDPTGHFDVDPDGNKILPTGKYIAAPSKPSTSYRSTPSSHKQSKPSAQRAKAKVQAKSSGSSSKQRSIKQWVQTGLDLAGNAPGPLGAVSDGVNALIYLADGDYQNAALSGVAVLPGGSILKNGIKAGRTSSKMLKGMGNIPKKPYSNGRPSYGKGQVEQVWDNARDPITGKVYDPSGAEIIWDKSKRRNGQWDMGHTPGNKYSEVHELYMNGTMTKKEFLAWYKDPANYRPELPSTNRGHKYE